MAIHQGGWKTELEAATSAARQGGQVLLDWIGRFAITKKGMNDYVTDADYASQDLICKRLAREFPDDEIMAEERGLGTPSPNRKGRRWVIDPLDGTTNYAHGFPFYCVSIGLECDGVPVVGAIFDPIRKESFCAARGGGASCNGVGIHANSTSRIEDALLGVGLPADLKQKEAVLGVFVRLARNSRSMRRMGSAALSLAYVACGRLDGFWASNLNPWDAAAGVVLVAEAGGRVTQQDGQAYNLYKPDILATNGVLHASMLAEVGGSPEAVVR